jgi:hypothetical protein
MQCKSQRRSGMRLCGELCHFNKNQGKTKTFLVSRTENTPSHDSENEMSTPRRYISCIKARSKYLRSVQHFWPKFPSTCGRQWLDLNKSANQDRSRGRNYTSNRGGHATYDGRVRLDSSGNQDSSWRPYVMRTPEAAMCTSSQAARVYQPWQVFQRWRLQSPEGPLHDGKCSPKMPGASSFSKTDRYRVTSTLARRQWLIFRVATIFVAAHPTRTFPERTKDGCCHYHIKTTFEPGTCVRLDRCSKDLNQRSCPVYPARRGDGAACDNGA